MAVPSGERSSTTYLFHFNVERKTYSEEAQTADMDPIVLSSGSYTCMEKDGAGILTARADSGEEQKYLLDGKYLIGQSCFYKGMIPDTDTFEAVCTYTEDTGLYHKIMFHEDGTYDEKVGSAADMEDEEKLAAAHGSYRRDGDKIRREADDGSRLIDFLVYNGKITNSYYTAD